MQKKLNCILLIDDDEATNFYNKMVVEEMDIAENIQVSQSGRDALDFLTNAGKHQSKNTHYPAPDLIFLDINMPAMDGWEFLEHYHQLDDLQKGKIVVVMLTTSLNPDDAQKAETINDVAGYRSKPLSREMITEILQQHFDGQ